MIAAARLPARSEPAKSQFFLLCRVQHNRNSWLFAGSLREGQRAAAVMSLIQSAELTSRVGWADGYNRKHVWEGVR